MSLDATLMEPEAKARSGTSPRRILLAEDNEAMRSLLARALRREGYEVEEARNGFELMHWVDQLTRWEQPTPLVDLIVTDLRMPIFSGFECLEQLRFGGSNVPVIVITAFGDWLVHERAHEHGAQAVFDKPLDIGELRGAIADLLSADS